MRLLYLTLSSMRHSMSNLLISVVRLLVAVLSAGTQTDMRHMYKKRVYHKLTSCRTICGNMNLEIVFELTSY
jgi:hypothetical protein